MDLSYFDFDSTEEEMRQQSQVERRSTLMHKEPGEKRTWNLGRGFVGVIADTESRSISGLRSCCSEDKLQTYIHRRPVFSI